MATFLLKHNYKLTFKLLSFITTIPILLVIATQSNAEIVPDKSLGSHSSIVKRDVTKRKPSEVISGGLQTGHSLIHSFTKFNVRKDHSAYFTSASNIKNIIARVTGNFASYIRGTLGVIGKGSSNLYFINPNGIIFGRNARLDLNGSFTVTTANDLKFKSGTLLSEIKGESSQNLNIKRPVGLLFQKNNGQIIVRGNGHNLITPGSGIAPIYPSGSPLVGLQAGTGKSIAFISSSIKFMGGIITAPSGNIWLSAIEDGEVSLSTKSNGSINFGFNSVVEWGDIFLGRLSLLNANTFGNSNINIFGDDITMTDDSLVLINSFGNEASGAIRVKALGDLKLIGDTRFTPLYPFPSAPARGLVTQSFGKGRGASIVVEAQNLVVSNAGRVLTASYGGGLGGSLLLDIEHSTKILGNSPFNPSYPLGSVVGTTSASDGEAGNARIRTDTLVLLNGGQFSSASFQDSDSGNVSVFARTIFMQGYNEVSLVPSLLTSITQGAGDGGKLSIRTDTIQLLDGARIDTSTLGSGDAGDLSIHAAKSITASGTIPGSLNPTLISASANIVDRAIQEGLGLPRIPTGAAGDLRIKTSQLTLTDGARISVKADGPGKGGKLTLIADRIDLKNSEITASSNGGGGGAINIRSNLLYLSNGKILASAKKRGNGGNVEIKSDFIVGDKSSKIIANSDNGLGGNININSKGFLFPEENISASSQLGSNYSGTIQINSNQFEFSPAIVDSIQPVSGVSPITCSAMQTDDKASVKSEYGELPEQAYSSVHEMPSRPENPSMYYLDLKTGQRIPFQGEMNGWKDNGDGTASPISFDADAKVAFANEYPCYRAF